MNIAQLVTGPLSVNTWCFPLDEKRIVVTDPGGNADMIIAHLEELQAVPALFLLTHGHFDHLTALPELARAFPDTPIAIHEADSSFLGEGALERHLALFTEIGGASLVSRYFKPLPRASVFLRDGDDLCVAVSRVPDGFAPHNSAERLADASGLAGGGLEKTGWRVIHTPGHSKGSVCLYSEREGTLLSGDTLFNSGVGRTDAPGGDSDELERSLEKLARLPPDTLVLPGHGMRTTIGVEFGVRR